MIEESASEEIGSSIWAFINTPTALFILLNLMILTIFFTSTFSLSKNHNVAKSPPQSLLQRIKSIDFNQRPNPEDSDTLQQSHYFFQENLEISHSQQPPQYIISDQTHQNNPQQTPTHLVFEQKDSNFEDFQQARDEEKNVLDEQSMTDSHFISRTKSDTEPASGEFPTKLPARMRKSASLKSAFGHFEEEVVVEARRPATVRVTGNAKVTGGDEEVDAKADDFINRFKQQLKLQRLDSIIRYKDMIGRVTGGG
ncbi:hypothetical protein ABFX02_01G013300 [Erythranthe guttata]